MKQINKFAKHFLPLSALMVGNALQAAPITWGAAAPFTAESDIDTAGNIVWAVNAGQDFLGGMGLVTINGVLVDFEDVNLEYATFNSDFFGVIEDHLPGENTSITFDVTTRRHPVALGTNDASLVGACADLVNEVPPEDPQSCREFDANTGNETLDSFLASSIFTDGRDSVSDVIGGGPGPVSQLNMQLRGLTPGTQYQIQLIADTSRLDGFFSLNDGEGNALPNFNSVQSDGTGPTVATGTFTADATEQAVNVVLEGNRNPGISMAILTDLTNQPPEETNVPFPTAGLGVMAIALSYLGFRTRNRKIK